MRILIVNTYSDRSELAMYQGFADAGMEVELICAPDAPEREATQPRGFAVTALPIRHRVDLPAAVRLRRLLRDRPPDAVYAPRNSTLAVALFASWGLRRHAIVAYRGTVGHVNRSDPASWIAYLNPRVDAIVCVSEAVRRYLRSVGVPERKLATVHKGHDPAWYAYPSVPTRTELGLPEDAFVIGFTGSLRPVKGVEDLLSAAAVLPESVPAHLALVGEVRVPRLREQADSLGLRGRVTFMGHCIDAARLARAFDVFVMPSTEREGLPRAVIEAMAQGVPVIVTDVGGMPELVEDGVSGLVVPPRHPAALAEAIVRLASAPALRQRMGDAARERIRKRFHIETTIASMLDVLRKAAES